MPKTEDPRWSDDQIKQMSRVRPSDVARALALIREASPELYEMIEAAQEEDG